MTNYAEYVLKHLLEEDSRFGEAREIARSNIDGRIWLIGGGVFRNIARAITGKKSECKDFDFITEKDFDPEKLVIPAGWDLTKNNFGSPKIIRNSDGFTMDLVALSKVPYIAENGLPDILDNFFIANPLNIQAIAYRINDGILEGEVGINALTDGHKIVRPHNSKELGRYCRFKRIPRRGYVREKAESIGFDYEYQSQEE